ncbi:MAG: RND family efflux transporter MFP subunit [Reinekea sp.]|jgi:RND family efflux transporter MFP subunit
MARFGCPPQRLMTAVTMTFIAAAAFTGQGPAAAQTLLNVPINCTLKPLQEVQLSAPVSGVVRQVMVRPGERVAAGDVVVQLDDRLAQAEHVILQAQSQATATLMGAQARAAALETKVARLQRGFNQNAISAAELEAARLELEDARSLARIETERLTVFGAQLARSEATLALFVVTSPVSGVVGEDLVDEGESVTQGPVATIYVNQPLRVEAFVPASQLAAFLERDSYPLEINGAQIAAQSQFDYRAEIADLASNTVSVYFKLDAPDVLPGSQCEIARVGG